MHHLNTSHATFNANLPKDRHHLYECQYNWIWTKQIRRTIVEKTYITHLHRTWANSIAIPKPNRSVSSQRRSFWDSKIVPKFYVSRVIRTSTAGWLKHTTRVYLLTYNVLENCIIHVEQLDSTKSQTQIMLSIEAVQCSGCTEPTFLFCQFLHFWKVTWYSLPI